MNAFVLNTKKEKKEQEKRKPKNKINLFFFKYTTASIFQKHTFLFNNDLTETRIKEKKKRLRKIYNHIKQHEYKEKEENRGSILKMK